MKISINKLIIAGILTIGGYSCTDLDETVYSTATSENFFKTDAEFIATIAPSYTQLKSIYGSTGSTYMWSGAQIVSDEMMIPTRGSHWYDGGNWRRMHDHTWTTEESQFNDTWTAIYAGINNCNRALKQFDEMAVQLAAKDQIIAEVKSLRAFYYYLLLDLFGNVPLITTFDVKPDSFIANSSRKQIYDFIITELNANIGNLTATVSGATYGRFTKYATYTLLAKLYLNAEVWSGTPEWNNCIVACDSVINSLKYNLESDYFKNFKAANESSKENIFVVPFDEVMDNDPAPRLILHNLNLHYANQQTFQLKSGPWNGMCAVPSFYNSFDPVDKRIKGWLIGQQYSSTGDILKCQEESKGQDLIFTADVSSFENAKEYEGARFAKYEYEVGAGACMNNDFVVFRFADVLLMKAECLLRNGDKAGAATLVNQVRKRSFAPEKPISAADLNLDLLLAERGFEFYGEAIRRQDQIRFNTFTAGTWTYKNASEATRALWPIPKRQLDLNPALKQNPGY